ncbi:alternative ribosome rescue aminoacyl-tRNA hydrolase ArfB [Snuella sedimenti]|uniref:Aminoacyl-tRNA hydrolase n=1 Tax=Snuella sedimenti TaxID=2798802 RepID=A0A8J7J4D2_9FLAO|nr:alternative ribosome rescue aminoacyl-tRNA hydrolase ArfB [Snuella sedimenti]MBJ6369667.1 aminoacyl-tRNA hydrolase [Snuella sedimenti]
MINKETLLQEAVFKAVRSSGSGGQHVNKVASKVELMFDLEASLVFNDGEKQRIKEKLKHRLTTKGVLVLQCDESRSQHKNKELVAKRFFDLIRTSLVRPKKRVPTKVPKAVIRKRLKSKRIRSDRKENRKKPDID